MKLDFFLFFRVFVKCLLRLFSVNHNDKHGCVMDLTLTARENLTTFCMLSWLVSLLCNDEIDSPEQHNCYNYSCIISSWRFAGHTLNQISRLSFSYLILVSTYRFCSCFFVIMCMTGITTALVQMKASFMILDRPCREHW